MSIPMVYENGKKVFEKFHGKLELDEKTADEIIEIEVWDWNDSRRFERKRHTHYPKCSVVKFAV